MSLNNKEKITKKLKKLGSVDTNSARSLSNQHEIIDQENLHPAFAIRSIVWQILPALAYI